MENCPKRFWASHSPPLAFMLVDGCASESRASRPGSRQAVMAHSPPVHVALLAAHHKRDGHVGLLWQGANHGLRGVGRLAVRIDAM